MRPTPDEIRTAARDEALARLRGRPSLRAHMDAEAIRAVSSWDGLVFLGGHQSETG